MEIRPVGSATSSMTLRNQDWHTIRDQRDGPPDTLALLTVDDRRLIAAATGLRVPATGHIDQHAKHSVVEYALIAHIRTDRTSGVLRGNVSATYLKEFASQFEHEHWNERLSFDPRELQAALEYIAHRGT